ncbi:MAG: polysaccharide deacetylase family protein [Oscillospiraceae bacterium]|nr:polysaccharide deacetylase family protein [Oscillospiraceae bacterium]
MEKKKSIAISVLVAVLALSAAIFGFGFFSNRIGNPPKTDELSFFAAPDSEFETQKSTFLELEILAWKKDPPLSAAEEPEVIPEPTEKQEENASAEPQIPDREPLDEPIPENQLLKVFVSLASDPPPEPETTLSEPEIFPPEAEPDQIPKEPDFEPSPVLQLQNDGTEKFLVISFDDGPGPHTERLLEIFADNKAKATFFVVGYKIPSYKETIKRMVEHGHQVAGHSWNHPYFTKSSNEKIRWELQSTNDAIYEVTGITPKFYRVPYGAYNDNIKNISKEMGLSLIQWNIDVLDWKLRNANAVYNNIMSMAKDGGVICVHDVHSTTVDAMERAVPDLIASGYTLLTVSEMFGDMEPGRVYYNRGYSK